MTLTELFSIYSQFKMGERPLCEISSITCDSRSAAKGDVFVAIRGHSDDGHKYLNDVCARDVAAVVVEDESKLPETFTGGILRVPSTRVAVGELSARFYGEPARFLYNVGVTGTSGKTSVTYLVEAILNKFGMPTGVVGTVDHHLGSRQWPTTLTSPDPITLQKRLAEFQALGAKAIAMEVSSQALDQERTSSVPFDVAIFTNLTREHLDYHKTMDEYFRAKEKLFRPAIRFTKAMTAILNVDDEWARKLDIGQGIRRWTYGESESDFQFHIRDMDFSGTRFCLKTRKGDVEVKSPLIGRHNVYNAVAAMAAGVAAGASIETCAHAVEEFAGVPGRMQAIPNDRGVHVLVDYAHKIDALTAVLQALRSIQAVSRSNPRILTVFGCGGDRDKGKRPLMAQAAIANSDFIFVTSDNPRTEAPVDIIRDILGGVPVELMNKRVFVEVDRCACIEKAIGYAKPGDVVLIAGKGHEKYQIIGSQKYIMDDTATARSFLQEN